MGNGTVGLILPGVGHTADRPALRLTALELEAHGAEVTVVEYRGGGRAAWDLARAGQWTEVVDTVRDQVVEASRDAGRVVVVAKSLGAVVAARLADLLPATTEAIWLTPLTHDRGECEAMARTGWRSLFIHGTDDPAHDAANQTALADALDATVVGIAPADHVALEDLILMRRAAGRPKDLRRADELASRGP